MRKIICQKSTDGPKFTWIDIEQPTREELTSLAVEFDLSGHVVEDCMQPDHLPKVEEGTFADFILLRQHLWPLGEEDDTIQEISTKVAIFYNSELVITIHRRPQPFLENIYHQSLGKTHKITADEVITRILGEVVDSYEIPLSAMSNALEALEDDIFLRQKTPIRLQEDLYYMKRKAAKVRKLLYLTTQVARKHHPGTRDKHTMNNILDSLQKMEFESDQVHENASSLLDTYLAIATHRTNEIMRVLTIFSVFFLPLTFIVGIYGMNFRYMPELGWTLGYPFTIALMLAITLSIFFWFRRKRWI
jgi:magnesium transporter